MAAIHRPRVNSRVAPKPHGSLLSRIFVRPWLATVRRGLPPLSATEREALQAGSVGWEALLFQGRPDWRAWLAEPAGTLTAEEQAFLEGPVDTLCGLVDDWAVTRNLHDLPPPVWRLMKEQGFFGLAIPKVYGGREFSPLAQSAVVVKIASRSLSAAVTAMVPNSIGPAKLLLRYGTDAQQRHWLPRLASGREIPCFALTGPTAGSDASAIPDTGIVCRRDGRLGILLNWDKRYITLGPVATVLGLAFQLRDPDRLLGAAEGITLALVPADTPGVEIGRRHLPLDQVFQNGPTRGRNVFIPVEQIIGGPDYAGRGWFMLMETLAGGRAISLPALAVGAGKLCALTAGSYAAVRHQFHHPIARFEGVAERLGRIAGNVWLAEAARHVTATANGRGEHSAVVSAMLKQNLTERMRVVVNDAMDVLAGKGIMLGPRNLLGRLYEAVPIAITVEGANILTRGLIVFGQGSVRCHPYLLAEMDAAASTREEAGETAFAAALGAHLRYVLGTLGRVVGAGRFGWMPSGPTRAHYRSINRLSAGFALASEVALLTLKGTLKRREMLSGRLADAFTHLFLAACVLKRFEDAGRPEAERPLVDWCCRHCLAQTEAALGGVIANLPHRGAAMLLRLLILPFGRRCAEPADRLTLQLAGLLTNPGPLRERLTCGIYRPNGAEDTLAVLERAFAASMAVQDAEQRLQRAVHEGRLDRADNVAQAVASSILTPADAVLIEQASRAAREAERVDDFPPDLGQEA